MEGLNEEPRKVPDVKITSKEGPSQSRRGFISALAKGAGGAVALEVLGDNEAQAQNIEKDPLVQVNEWLKTFILADYKGGILNGSTIQKAGREAGFSLEKEYNFNLVLGDKNIKQLTIKGDLTLEKFIEALNTALGFKDPEFKKPQTPETVNAWLNELRDTTPSNALKNDLAGISISIDPKGSGPFGAGAYRLIYEEKNIYDFYLPTKENNKENFQRALLDFFSGKKYKDELKDVETTFRGGAVKVLALNGVYFKDGMLCKRGKGDQIPMTPRNGNPNKTIIFSVVDGNKINMKFEELNGKTGEGILDFNDLFKN